MHKLITIISVAVYGLLALNGAHAGPFCEKFNSVPPSKQGQYILSLADERLSKWPQNQKMKAMMSNSERLNTMFSDARGKITFACKSGNDFVAGVALGEDLAIYKMALLEIK